MSHSALWHSERHCSGENIALKIILLTAILFSVVLLKVVAEHQEQYMNKEHSAIYQLIGLLSVIRPSVILVNVMAPRCESYPFCHIGLLSKILTAVEKN